MIDSFYLASIPRPPKVLGLQLKPFALGHVILLNFIESAFVTGGVPDYSDLAISTLLCASTYEEGCSHLFNPDTERSMRVWAEKLTGMNRLSVRLGIVKPRTIDLVKEVSKFLEYYQESTQSRSYEYKEEDFSTVECQQVQIVKLSLMRDLHISEKDIMDRPWALCMDDYITLRALNGHVRLVDKEGREKALAAANELAERIRKGEIVIPCQS